MAECPHFLAKQQLPCHSKQVISQVLNYVYLKLTTVKVATAILAMPLLSQELVFLATSHFYIMSQFSVYIAAPEHGNGSLPFLVLQEGYCCSIFFHCFLRTICLVLALSFFFTHPPPSGSFPPCYVFFSLGFGQPGDFDTPTQIFLAMLTTSFLFFYICIMLYLYSCSISEGATLPSVASPFFD